MGAMLNGLGAGFLFAIFLSLYVDTFIGKVIPIWITYGILGPFISAVAIAAILYSKKEDRERYLVKGYYEKKEEE